VHTHCYAMNSNAACEPPHRQEAVQFTCSIAIHCIAMHVHIQTLRLKGWQPGAAVGGHINKRLVPGTTHPAPWIRLPPPCPPATRPTRFIHPPRAAGLASRAGSMSSWCPTPPPAPPPTPHALQGSQAGLAVHHHGAQRQLLCSRAARQPAPQVSCGRPAFTRGQQGKASQPGLGAVAVQARWCRPSCRSATDRFCGLH
jgi:hypothetical protein